MKTSGLIVRARVEFVGRMKDGKVFFIGRFGCAEATALFHRDYYCCPVLDGDDIIPGSPGSGDPEDLGDIAADTITIVRGVCEYGPKGPRAVWWCFLSDYVACEQKLAQRQEKLRGETEARRLAAVERAATAPWTFDEALKLGWVVVSGSNGRQRILERQFAGEVKPRRITRHQPPAKGQKSTGRRSLALVS